jgi:hypothetical protein
MGIIEAVNFAVLADKINLKTRKSFLRFLRWVEISRTVLKKSYQEGCQIHLYI